MCIYIAIIYCYDHTFINEFSVITSHLHHKTFPYTAPHLSSWSLKYEATKVKTAF